MQCLLCFSGESLHLDSQQPEDSGTCFLGGGVPTWRIIPVRGESLTMVINHLLTGMILQAESMKTVTVSYVEV